MIIYGDDAVPAHMLRQAHLLSAANSGRAALGPCQGPLVTFSDANQTVRARALITDSAGTAFPN